MGGAGGAITALRAAALAVATVLLAIGGLVLGGRAVTRAAPAMGTNLPAQAGESRCDAHVAKFAAPAEVDLGDPVTITLHARVECPEPPLHIVLVLQGSSSVAGSVHRDIQLAARETVDALDLADNPEIKMGVVGFNERGRRLCDLTNDGPRLLSCINRLGQTGDVSIDAGIDEGMRVFRRGRSDVEVHMLTEVMIVMTDGQNDAGCSPAVRAAGQVKGEGVLVLSVCAGQDCDSQCVRQIASSSRYYYDSLPDYVAALRVMFERVRLVVAPLRGLTITDTLPHWMRYEPGSAVPEPAAVSPSNEVFTWVDEIRSVRGMTVSLSAVPQELGYLATNLAATGTLTDYWGLTKTFEFDVPWVTVRDSGGTPGPPPPSPQAIHAALVLDGSASMAGQPNAQMQAGAIAFVEYLAPSDNLERRVSVSEFASRIERHCDLTNVTGHAVRCIREVDAAGGSQPDLGIADGLAALREGRHLAPAGPREAIVMLTDGGHASGCEPITRVADEAKSEGVAVFTICLGSWCDSACMRLVGSGDGYSYDTDDPADLPAIYLDIARKLVEGLPPTPGPSPTATATIEPTVAATDTPAGETATPTSGPPATSTSAPTPGPSPPGMPLYVPSCHNGMR